MKLGPGGIREVEFFAAALQLLHGGRLPALRMRSTQRALRRLVEAGPALAHRRRRIAGGLRLPPPGGEPAPDGGGPADPGAARPPGRTATGWPTGSASPSRRLRRRAGTPPAAGGAEPSIPSSARRPPGSCPASPSWSLALDPDLPDAERSAALRTARLPRRGRGAGLGATAPSSPRSGPPGGGARALGGRGALAPRRGPEPGSGPGAVLPRGVRRPCRHPRGYLRLLQQRPAVGRRLLDLFGQSAYLSAELVRTPELLDQLVILGRRGAAQVP